MLAGTVTSLAPFFALAAFLPPLIGSADAEVVVVKLAIGVGQVIGTTLVPRLVAARGPRVTVVLGTVLIAAGAFALTVLAGLVVPATAVLAVIGFAGGIVVVPQQARLFTLIPRLAPVALGLNGSAIYVASALCAGMTGAALGGFGAEVIPVTAAVLGMLGSQWRSSCGRGPGAARAAEPWPSERSSASSAVQSVGHTVERDLKMALRGVDHLGRRRRIEDAEHREAERARVTALELRIAAMPVRRVGVRALTQRLRSLGLPHVVAAVGDAGMPMTEDRAVSQEA